jgi:hypothetical protein
MGRSRQAVEKMKRFDPIGVYTRLDDPDNPDQQIAIFRRDVGDITPPRIYQPYKYRSGLRFKRLLCILGRHG